MSRVDEIFIRKSGSSWLHCGDQGEILKQVGGRGSSGPQDIKGEQRERVMEMVYLSCPSTEAAFVRGGGCARPVHRCRKEASSPPEKAITGPGATP